MDMAWEWYQREPERRGRELVACGVPWGGTAGVPSSSAPSTSEGMRKPCQWTNSGVSVVVDDIDGDGLAFLHAQDGPGDGAVVADGGEDAVGREFDGDRGDAQGDIGCLGGGGGGGGCVGAGKHDHLGCGRGRLRCEGLRRRGRVGRV